jgi:hypothetical protein
MPLAGQSVRCHKPCEEENTSRICLRLRPRSSRGAQRGGEHEQSLISPRRGAPSEDAMQMQCGEANCLPACLPSAYLTSVLEIMNAMGHCSFASVYLLETSNPIPNVRT